MSHVNLRQPLFPSLQRSPSGFAVVSKQAYRQGYRQRIKNLIEWMQSLPKPFCPFLGSLSAKRDALFPSGYYHQITPVHYDTNDFGDARFTLNGWIYPENEKASESA